MENLSVIFDIDGVIVDSEQLHFDVLKDLAPEKIANYRPEQLIGLSLDETLDFIGVDKIDQKSISDNIITTYKNKLSSFYLRPSIKKTIHALEENNTRFGFVSTAPREICEANLSLLELKKAYQLISGDDVVNTKPHPDPYIFMMKRLFSESRNTIVIEDTDIGISSARKAGIEKVYAWPHALSKIQSYDQAVAIVNNLKEIPYFFSLMH